MFHLLLLSSEIVIAVKMKVGRVGKKTGCLYIKNTF